MQVLQQLSWYVEERRADLLEQALEQLFNDAQASRQAALALELRRESNWAALVWHWCQAATFWHDGQRTGTTVEKVFQELKNALGSLYDELREETSGNWALPIAHLLCRYLVRCALQELVDSGDVSSADRERRARLTEAETITKKGLALMLSDRTAQVTDSKKRGSLGMIVYLLRIYFALNNLRMCSSLLRTVESPGFPALDETFPLDQRVTYHYFVGRIALYEDRYDDAETHLAFAARNCPMAFGRNRRRIWMFLVPVRLVQGRLPSTRLLRRYRLQPYEYVCQAILRGDLHRFDDILRIYRQFFVRSGVLFTIEKLRLIAYRNRFRVAARILNSTRIPLTALQCVLPNPQPVLEEVECIVANLIYRGYIRGYISHQKKYLVTSAKDAFPAVSRVAPDPCH
ncbi:hypothetical protein CCYA_CCYA02G0467 [Cyanidiococcus yangmingshanensis]|nr:hypothetical protein CCYA_CCYA02G0467 [Cyanidiococcus yangmingshanensis]